MHLNFSTLNIVMWCKNTALCIYIHSMKNIQVRPCHNDTVPIMAGTIKPTHYALEKTTSKYFKLISFRKIKVYCVNRTIIYYHVEAQKSNYKIFLAAMVAAF